MKLVLRLVLLCAALAFMMLALTRYLLSEDSPMRHLPGPFIEWCVAIYQPQNAEEVADLEFVLASVISVALTSFVAWFVLLSRKWRHMNKG